MGGPTGGCSCGAVRYASAVDPIMALYCQCRDCQRDSGTGHSCHVMLPKSLLSLMGNLKRYESVADSGNPVYRGFCPECGSSVTYGTTAFPDAVFVTAGSLDDPSWFKPLMVVYASTAQPWDHVDPSLPRFQEMPPLERAE
jgi:hypothetical protein